MKYIMLDIETLGTAPGSAITSISAVEFNEEGETGEEFHRDIQLKSCADIGLKMDSDTVIWWFKQSKEAIAQLSDDRPRVGISSALIDFNQWVALRKSGDFEKVFAKDPDFDCAIIEDVCRRLNYPFPFKYSEKIAVRTISWLRPNFEKEEKFVGVKHNGVDDCKHQIKYVIKALKELSLDFNFKWEKTTGIRFSTYDEFYPGDVIAFAEDIQQYAGNVPKEKLIVVSEEGLSMLASKKEFILSNPMQEFGKMFSAMLEKDLIKKE